MIQSSPFIFRNICVVSTIFIIFGLLFVVSPAKGSLTDVVYGEQPLPSIYFFDSANETRNSEILVKDDSTLSIIGNQLQAIGGKSHFKTLPVFVRLVTYILSRICGESRHYHSQSLYENK
jgi:hypothetical protein